MREGLDDCALERCVCLGQEGAEGSVHFLARITHEDANRPFACDEVRQGVNNRLQVFGCPQGEHQTQNNPLGVGCEGRIVQQRFDLCPVRGVDLLVVRIAEDVLKGPVDFIVVGQCGGLDWREIRIAQASRRVIHS